VKAEIARRPEISKLAPDEARQEQAIRDALRKPGTVAALPAARRLPHPVLLWLRPEFPAAGKPHPDKSPEQSSQAANALQSDKKRRTAEHTEMPERKGGLMLFRPEPMGWTPPHLNGIYVPNWSYHTIS